MKNTNSLLNLNTQNAYTHIGFQKNEYHIQKRAMLWVWLSTYHNVNLSGVYRRCVECIIWIQFNENRVERIKNLFLVTMKNEIFIMYAMDSWDAELHHCKRFLVHYYILMLWVTSRAMLVFSALCGRINCTCVYIKSAKGPSTEYVSLCTKCFFFYSFSDWMFDFSDWMWIGSNPMD